MLEFNKTSEIIKEWTKVYMHHSLHDFKHFLKETGLSFTHLNILLRLFHTNTIRVSEIGKVLGMTNAAASQSIDRLVNLKLVLRSEDDFDRRVKKLELTNSGNELLRRGIESRSKWLERLITSLSQEQQEMVLKSFSLLTEAAENLP